VGDASSESAVRSMVSALRLFVSPAPIAVVWVDGEGEESYIELRGRKIRKIVA
jgi:hypothetical protein